MQDILYYELQENNQNICKYLRGMPRRSNSPPTAPPNERGKEHASSMADLKLGDLAADGCGRDSWGRNVSLHLAATSLYSEHSDVKGHQRIMCVQAYSNYCLSLENYEHGFQLYWGTDVYHHVFFCVYVLLYK
jgi:hypothetical protein